MDDTLQASADVLAELLAQPGNAPVAGQTISGPVADKHFAWQLVGAQHQLLLRSSLAPPRAWAPVLEDGLADVDGAWRVFGRPLPGDRMLYVAQTRAERVEVRIAVGLASAGTAALVGLLCALWLGARVRRELAPLANFSEAIQRHDPLAPGASLARPEREELLPIRDAIEALGQRLARRVANERAFSAHAAHALRTPLAGMDAQLAVALRESPPALQPRLLRTREAAGRLSRVVTALLTLFRSGVDLRRQPVDLAALLQRLPVEGLQIEVAEPAPLLDADLDLLAAALLNLLDNALRHGAGRLRVEVHAEPAGITLYDDGKGATPERLAELQQALAEQDYEGHMGLGLMLADMVARAHGGGLQLLPVPSGFALDLRLKLPG